jgi:hypothetical protein
MLAVGCTKPTLLCLAKHFSQKLLDFRFYPQSSGFSPELFAFNSTLSLSPLSVQ